MSEPKQPEDRIYIPKHPAMSFAPTPISARIERDPTKLPPMRWVKKDGSYRLEVAERRPNELKVRWVEVPFWQGGEE